LPEDLDARGGDHDRLAQPRDVWTPLVGAEGTALAESSLDA
jgi:hypothetical protein